MNTLFLHSFLLLTSIFTRGRIMNARSLPPVVLSFPNSTGKENFCRGDHFVVSLFEICPLFVLSCGENEMFFVSCTHRRVSK